MYITSVEYLQDLVQLLNSLLGISLIFTTIFVSTRIFIQCRLSRSFGIDDLFLLVTQVSLPLPPINISSVDTSQIQISFTLFATSSLLSVYHGIGSKPEHLDEPETLSLSLKYWFMSDLLYITTISLLRLSISFHLRKYSKTAEQRWYLLALSLFTAAWNAGYFATVLFKCKPIEYFWTGWLGAKGSCGNASESAYAAYGFAGLGGLTDGVLMLITVWITYGRELNERLKSGLKALMGLGCL